MALLTFFVATLVLPGKQIGADWGLGVSFQLDFLTLIEELVTLNPRWTADTIRQTSKLKTKNRSHVLGANTVAPQSQPIFYFILLVLLKAFHPWLLQGASSVPLQLSP